MTEGEFYTFTRFGDAPHFIICDHASNHVPEDLNCLGLPDDILETHIAWDIGARAVAAAIAEKLGGALFSCGVSRLVVDVNRSKAAPDLIPAVSDQIPVPGNQMLTDEARAGRLARFHDPYHAALSAALDEAAAAGPVFITSIHSFTRRLMGAAQDRPWPIGLLWSHDEASAKCAINWLTQKTGWPIGDNEPYDAREFNYTIDTHVAPNNWPHLTFEVRQDKVCDADGVDAIADLLAGAIDACAKRATPKNIRLVKGQSS